MRESSFSFLCEAGDAWLGNIFGHFMGQENAFGVPSATVGCMGVMDTSYLYQNGFAY